MLSSLFQPSELKIHLLQNVVFVHPPEGGPRRPQAEDAPPQTDDELVRGLIELHVPTDRHIGGICIRLRASETVGIMEPTMPIPVAWDERLLMEKTLDIGVPVRHPQSRSRAISRAPSRNPSRAPSPQDTASRSRRGSIDSGADDRGRMSSRVASQSRRDHSVTGLASALAATFRGRSSSRASAARSASRASRPPSPSGRGRAGSRDPSAPPRTPSNLGNSSYKSERRSASTQRGSSMSRVSSLVDEEEYRGRPFHRPSIVPEEGAPSYGASVSQHHHGHHFSLLHHSSHDSSQASRSSSVGYSDRTEPGASTPDHHTVDDEPDEEGMFVAKGVHGFEFAFILPSDCAPFERSPYGRVRYTIKATAIGAGRAKSNIEVTREIFPMAVPSIESPTTPMSVMYHDLHETVGLLSIACTSNNISVGGVFNIDVHSPMAPPDLAVYMVRVSLETQVELHTVKKGKQYVGPLKHRLFEKGFIPKSPADMHESGAKERIIRWCGNDDAWSVQGIARVPDDNVIRPTTLPGSRGDIRFSHQLAVEIIHSRDPLHDGLPADSDRSLKAFTLRQPVVIPSCCVAYSAVTLPRYEEKESASSKKVSTYRVPDALAPPEESPFTIAVSPRNPSGHEFCVCGMSLADLEAQEHNILPTTPGYNVPVHQVRHRGKIGEYAPVDDPAPRRNPSGGPSTPSSALSQPPALETSTRSSSPAGAFCERPSSRPCMIPSRSSLTLPRALSDAMSSDPRIAGAPQKDGAPRVHMSAALRKNVVHENIGGVYEPGMPLAPSPGGSGVTTPSGGMSRPCSRTRAGAQPDLSDAIPHLNSLAEAAEHDNQPPAYDLVANESEDEAKDLQARNAQVRRRTSPHGRTVDGAR